MASTLFTCKGMRAGKNMLYSEITNELTADPSREVDKTQKNR